MKKILEAIRKLLPKAKKPALVGVQRTQRGQAPTGLRTNVAVAKPHLEGLNVALKTTVYSFVVTLFAVTFCSCKKGFDAEPTYAKQTIATTWAKTEPFYQPTGERYDDATATWRKFSAFTVTSDGEPDKLGFANPYVAGKGTNALDMNRLYSSQGLTSDSGYYNITIPKCFQFVPNAADATQGTVLVLAQDVKIYRTDKSSFIIKLSPGSAPGTYNTVTKIFEVEISFDETSIGGAANVKRKYRFTA